MNFSCFQIKNMIILSSRRSWYTQLLLYSSECYDFEGEASTGETKQVCSSMASVQSAAVFKWSSRFGGNPGRLAGLTPIQRNVDGMGIQHDKFTRSFALWHAATKH